MSIANPNLFHGFDYELSKCLKFVKSDLETAFDIEFQNFYLSSHFGFLFLALILKSILVLFYIGNGENPFLKFVFLLSICANFLAFSFTHKRIWFVGLSYTAVLFEIYCAMILTTHYEFYIVDVVATLLYIYIVRVAFTDILLIGLLRLFLFLGVNYFDQRVCISWNCSYFSIYLLSWILMSVSNVYRLDRRQRYRWINIDSFRKTKTQFETVFDRFSFISGTMDSKLRFVNINAKAKDSFVGSGFYDIMTTEAFNLFSSKLNSYAWDSEIPYNSNHILNIKESGPKICDVYIQKVVKKEKIPFQFVFVVIRHEKFHYFLSFLTNLKLRAINKFRSSLRKCEEKIQKENNHDYAFFNPIITQMNTIANFYLTQNQIFESYSSLSSSNSSEQEETLYIVNYSKKLLDSMSDFAFSRKYQMSLEVEVPDDQVVMGKLWIIDRYLTNCLNYLFEKDLVSGLTAKISNEDKKVKLKLEFPKNSKQVNLDSLVNGEIQLTYDQLADSKLLTSEINLILLGEIMREAFIGFQVTELDKKITINVKFFPIKVADPTLPLFHNVNLLTMSYDIKKNIFNWIPDNSFIIKKLSSEELLRAQEEVPARKRKKSNIFVFNMREKLKLADISLGSNKNISSGKNTPRISDKSPLEKLSKRKPTPTFIKTSSKNFSLKIVKHVNETNLLMQATAITKKIVVNTNVINFSLTEGVRKKEGREFIEGAIECWQTYIEKLTEGIFNSIQSQTNVPSLVNVKVPANMLKLWDFPENYENPENRIDSETSILVQEKSSLRKFDRGNSMKLSIVPIEKEENVVVSPVKIPSNLLEPVEEKSDPQSEELFKIDEIPKKFEVSGISMKNSHSSVSLESSSLGHKNHSSQSQNSGSRNLQKSKFSTLETYISPVFEETPTFMILDDNAGIRLAMAKAKLDVQCKFITAKNGEIGFEKFKEFSDQKKNFHGIFLDIKMPEVSGPEFIKMVRNYEKELQLFRTYVWAMQNDEDEIIPVDQEGVDEIIKKPISRDLLNSKVLKRLEEIGEISLNKN